MTTTKVPSPSGRPPVPRLAALVHDARAGLHHRLLRFRTRAARARSCSILNQTFAEGDRAVVRQLAAADYPVPSGSADRAGWSQAIEAQRTERRLAYAIRSGGGARPVRAPRWVLGRARSGVLRRAARRLSGAQVRLCGVAGRLAGRGGGPGRGNHVLVFALALAFALPLLRLLGEEGGGFQLVAPYATGKSTAAEPPPRSGGTGTRRVAHDRERRSSGRPPIHNDLLLVLDESGLLGKDPRSRAGRAVRGLPPAGRQAGQAAPGHRRAGRGSGASCSSAPAS